MLEIVLIAATLATSLVSGVLSMAGGMILMGVFGFLLSVPGAMVLHGIAQTFSNGSRVWIYRHHIRAAVLLPYTLGAFLILGVFSLFAFVPPVGLVFLLIGSFPILALWMPTSVNLDMEKPPVSFCCGLIVTTAQMLAGASGPVLDVFYVKSNLTRFEILGTKAITQTLGHVLKLIYYLLIVGTVTGEVTPLIVAGVVAAAMAGNWLGKLVIDRIHDALFKRVGRAVILVIGVIYVGKGLVELIDVA